MNKQKAISLLKHQIQTINDPSINRKEWITTTVAVVQRIFPHSSAHKTEQIQNIENNPEYFQEISIKQRIHTKKSKAENHLLNYIEEIELLGMENYGAKMEMIFGSWRFWMILLTLCTFCFIGGTAAAETDVSFRQSVSGLIEEMERQLDLQQEEIDSLRKELQIERSGG